MKLLDKLVRQPAAVTLAYKDLEAHLLLLSKKKRDSIQGQVRKAKVPLQMVAMTVPSNTVAASLTALATAPGVNITLQGFGAAPPNKRQLFIATLALFDEVPPTVSTAPPVYDRNTASYKYPNLSVSYLNKHFAQSSRVAGDMAQMRYQASNAIAVSTFVVENDTHYLDGELALLNKIGLFKMLASWVFKGEAERRRTNTRVQEIVLRSKRQVRKWQCTQNNNFVPFATVDYMYYGISDSGGKTLLDHYVAAAQVTGFTELPLETLMETATQRDKSVDMEAVKTALTAGPNGDRVVIYISYGRAV
jgi:hypothetical protein